MLLLQVEEEPEEEPEEPAEEDDSEDKEDVVDDGDEDDETVRLLKQVFTECQTACSRFELCCFLFLFCRQRQKKKMNCEALNGRTCNRAGVWTCSVSLRLTLSWVGSWECVF